MRGDLLIRFRITNDARDFLLRTSPKLLRMSAGAFATGLLATFQSVFPPVYGVDGAKLRQGEGGVVVFLGPVATVSPGEIWLVSVSSAVATPFFLFLFLFSKTVCRG
jgi:hypothetical protein